eukprot:Gb_22220 [translate_table: standard]
MRSSDIIQTLSLLLLAVAASSSASIDTEIDKHRRQINTTAVGEYKQFGSSRSIPFKDPPTPRENFEYAMIQQDGRFYSAIATFDIWKPYVRNKFREYSTGQIWVIGNGEESIQAGWHVYPELYINDNEPTKTRFFILYTRKDLRCYNFQCTALVGDDSFKSTRHGNIVGKTFAEVSSHGALVTKEIRITLEGRLLVPGQPLAWFIYVDGEQQGYIPTTFFRGDLRERPGQPGYATRVQFGGHVSFYKSRRGVERHTNSVMGNGLFGKYDALPPPLDTDSSPACVYDIKVYDSPLGNSRFNSAPYRDVVTHPGCYNITSGERETGSYVYYGGAGYNRDICP